MPVITKIAPVDQSLAPQPARREPDRATVPLPALKPKPRIKAESKVRQCPDPPPLKMPVSAPPINNDARQAAKRPHAFIAEVTGQSVAQPSIREAVPLYDRNPPPQYPQQARKRGFHGTVMLKVPAGKDGRVADIRLEESSRHSISDQIALETVRNWAFKPGCRGEDAVEIWIRVPMLFELK